VKKILSITATVLVISVATILVYQIIFLQKPEKVLADVSKQIAAIKSADAGFQLTLDINGERIAEESGKARWTGKPTDIASFIDAKSDSGFGPQDKASFDVTVRTKNSERKFQKIQVGETVYLKGQDTGDKWVSYHERELSAGSEEFTGWRYINALLLATDYTVPYKDAKDIEVVEEGGKKLHRLTLPLKRDDWLKAVNEKSKETDAAWMKNVTLEMQVWVDYETALPVKAKIKFGLTEPEKVDCVFTITYSGFNQNIAIQVPSSDQVITRAQLEKRNTFIKDLGSVGRYVEERQYEKALYELKGLEVENADNVRVLELIAITYAGLGKLEEAELYSDKVLSLNKKSADAYRVKSDITLSQANQKISGIVSSYVVTIKRAIKLNDINMLYKATASLKSKYEHEFTEAAKDEIKTKYKDALKYALKATKINPSSAEAHYSLGNAYVVLNNRPSAMAAYERAIELKPGFLEAEYMLGVLYIGSSNRDKGARLIKKAASADVDKIYGFVAEILLSSEIKDKIPSLQEDILMDMAGSSSYLMLEKALQEKDKPVFLFFYDKKSPVAIDLADDLKRLEEEHGDEVLFLVFNVDGGVEASNLSEKYGVATTPTMLLFSKGGNILRKHEGYVDDEVLEQWIKNAKPKS